MPDIAATQSMFISRDRCISCGSTKLSEISGGSFGDEPLRSFIDSDPWGENPLPLLENERWSLVRCECGQAFHRRVLSPHWNVIRFSQWMNEDAIRAFEAEHGKASNATAHVQHVLRLKRLGVRRLLDFGCGFGAFIEMARLFDLEALGVDRSAARASGASVHVHPELEDVSGTFDAITMFEVLEHLDDPLTILRVLAKRLNPGGMMIVEVPDTSGVVGILSRDDYYKIHPLDHINAFTPDSLERIMIVAGFEPMWRTPAFVTTSPLRAVKDVLKEWVRRPTTQRYFQLRSFPPDSAKEWEDRYFGPAD